MEISQVVTVEATTDRHCMLATANRGSYCGYALTASLRYLTLKILTAIGADPRKIHPQYIAARTSLAAFWSFGIYDLSALFSGLHHTTSRTETMSFLLLFY